MIDRDGLDSVELKLRAILGDSTPLASPPQRVVGDVIGGTYEILRQLGQGGMGQVFVARHARTGGEVAIKLIRPNQRVDPGFIERFELEAKHTAALNHPNIVKVFDYGHDGGLAYIAMELVAGRSLAALLEDRGALEPDEALSIAAHTLRALQVAHAEGLVHRDIKPDNILVARDSDSWFVKVVDFGIAHTFQAPRPGPQEVIGSPSCMAPEQFNPGADITPRADLYAVGCTTYAMLAGRPPFEGGFWELAVFHAEQPPPPLPDVPAPLAEWVRWLLAKSPDERPASAQQALESLLDVERGHSVAPATGSRLPRIATSFVGRTDELQALDDHLLNGAKLITVTGTAGLGKTRLAIEWGGRNARKFSGGAYFCDLAEVRSVEGVCITVARALGTQLGDGDPVDMLGRVLRGRGEALVVFDNFEQIAEHAAATVGAWRQIATDATFVVTSRHRLSISGEQIVDLAPMAGTSAESDGVRLFVERAALVRPHFDPSEEEQQAIVDLVSRLDGIPLAIEMTAARTRTMSPKMVLDRLGQRFQLLRSSRRDISARQITMRAAIDWSWELLEEVEKAALSQCAAFAGSFDLDAAEAILDLSQYEDPWVADILESLVDKSLLRALEYGRFGMFVSVHDYAAEKLAATPSEDDARQRHLEYYARLGTEEALERREVGRAELEGNQRDIENLRAAIGYAERTSPGEEMGRCTVALTEYFQLRGPLRAGIELGERVLRQMPGVSFEKYRILASVGLIHVRAGEYAKALEYEHRSLAMARSLDDLRSEARALIRLGFVHVHFDRPDEARPWLEEGMEAAAEAGDQIWLVAGRFFIGTMHAALGELAEAKSHCQFALEVAVHVGNKRLEGWVRRVLASILQREGEMERVFDHAQRSYTLALELGETGSEAWALHSLGQALEHAGDFPAATAHYESALKLARECGEADLEVRTLCGLASTSETWGHPSARARAEEALRVARTATRSPSPLLNSMFATARAIHEQEPTDAMALIDEACRLAEAAPPTIHATALFQKAKLLADGSPMEALERLERVSDLIEAAEVEDFKAEVRLQRAQLQLLLGDDDGALRSVEAVQGRLARVGSAALRLTNLCVRAHVVAVHGRTTAATELCDEAERLRDALQLYPHATLAKLVDRTRRAVEAR